MAIPRFFPALVGAAALLAAAVAAQYAPVEDLSRPPSRAPAQGQGAPAANPALAELFEAIQGLREEVRELRGLVEEQGYELERLKQRQLEDYEDLDRRLAALAGGGGETPAPAVANRGAPPAAGEQSVPPPAAAAADSAPAPVGAPAAGGDDQAAYEAAYQLLRNRQIDEAVAAFRQFIAKYPSSPYTANAHYWLGEIHLLRNELGEAELAFRAVVERFPAHAKAADAKFKLAKVYHLQGRTDQARRLLEEVAAGSGTAATLARAYLRDHF